VGDDEQSARHFVGCFQLCIMTRANRSRNNRGAAPKQQPQPARQQPRRRRRAARSAPGGDGVHRHKNIVPAGLSPNHHFDAFGPQKPQALAFSVGPATHINGAARFAVTVPTVASGYQVGYDLFAFQPGSGIHPMIYCRYVPTSASAGAWGPVSHWDIPSNGIEINASASSPETVMCSRGSVRLRNTSPAAQVAGVVHILRVSTGIPNFYATPADAESVKALILTHKDTVTLSGSQLTQTQQWDCIPVSQDKYHGFIQPFGGNSTVLQDPGVSTILMLFETTPSTQYYEFSMAASYYARYRYSGPLANASMLPPTCPIGKANQARDLYEKMGSIGKPIVAAIGGALQDAATDALPGLIGNMFRQNRGFPPLGARFLPLPAP